MKDLNICETLFLVGGVALCVWGLVSAILGH